MDSQNKGRNLLALLIGYARTSTKYQDLTLQIDALLKAGVDKRNIYTDQYSGSRDDRPGLAEISKTLEEGDTLIVWRLDRLGRSMQHLVRFIEDLGKRGITFRSLNEQIETETAVGKLLLHIFASLCQFERDLTSERIRAGMLAKINRDGDLGRPKALTVAKEEFVWELKGKGWANAKIAREIGCSPQTIARAIARKREQL